MATNRSIPPKTAADLNRWLGDEVSPRLSEQTEAMAHGGTAFTMLGVKESTKDVDLSFRTREDFNRLVGALRDIGYEITRDFHPLRGEIYQRLRHPGSVVDVVDLRHPTWNGWQITKKVLRGALSIPRGRVTLVRPDVETVFLFKTYPLRDTDLADLQDTLKKRPPSQARVIELFDEQDETYRTQFMERDIVYEPVFRAVELRIRAAVSLSLMGKRYSRMISEIAEHVEEKFRELQIPLSLEQLASLLREGERPVNWDRILGERLDDLRENLAL